MTNVLSPGALATDPGQEGVRHELAGLNGEACWNMCGPIGSAAWRR